MGIRAVLFDLDDTLLDTRVSALAGLAATCALAAERCPELAEERIREAYHPVIREVDARLGAGELSFATAQELDEYRWREILARCGRDGAHAVALAERYRRSRREHYRLFADVAEALPQLPPSCRAALLTNGPGELQREKIAAVALERWIPRAFISGELGVWKPQPAIFRHALEQLGCAPEEAVMVGDSWHNDIAGAAAVGLRTVWVNRWGYRPLEGVPPDAIIEDLRPLPGLLRQWW